MAVDEVAMDEATFLPRLDEARIGQCFQVEGQRRRRYAERLADGADGHPLRAGFNQQAPGLESGFLRQCAEL